MVFDFDFTLEKLKGALPGIKDPEGWLAAAKATLPKYGITTKARVAQFLAQTGHESNNWNTLEENLNYRAETLLKVFSKYYKTQAAANADANKPEKIANKVYANRMGNGDTASGDGYRYRGRGILQVTGKSNYADCSKKLYNDDRLVKDPNLLKTKTGALESACWFWNKSNLNKPSDAKDVLAVTKAINGGTNGLDDRKARYDRIMKIL